MIFFLPASKRTEFIYEFNIFVCNVKLARFQDVF